MLTGQNGILTNAAKAKENTGAASDLQFLQTKAYEAVTNYYVKGQTGSENEYILEELGKVSGVETSVSQGTVKYNGKTYDISEIIGNTSEQKAIEKEEGLKQVTVATATDAEDKAILSSKDSARAPINCHIASVICVDSCAIVLNRNSLIAPLLSSSRKVITPL